MTSNERYVHFIRHAQSQFNKAQGAALHGQTVDLDSITLIDSDLSEKGKQQAMDVKPFITRLNIDLAITSPYKRAISTCFLAHGSRNILVTPLCGERFDAICDIGTPRCKLQQLYPQLDFSLLDDIWWFNPDACQNLQSVISWYNTKRQATTDDIELEPALKTRAETFYQFLLSRPEKNIAVFSHSHFLRMFLHWHFSREKAYIANTQVVSFTLP